MNLFVEVFSEKWQPVNPVDHTPEVFIGEDAAVWPESFNELSHKEGTRVEWDDVTIQLLSAEDVNYTYVAHRYDTRGSSDTVTIFRYLKHD